MEPTPDTAPTPNAGQSLVEYVRTQRQNAGYLLAGLAVLLLAACVFLALKAYQTPGGPGKSAEKSLAEDSTDPDKPPELPKASGDVVNLKRGDYQFGWVFCLIACLSTGGIAAWLIVGLPPIAEAKQRTEARVAILAVGTALGSETILAGLIFFYRWSDSLAKWLDKGDAKEARWVLIPLMMIILGAGIVFAAIQPARAEERNDTRIRRLVYGSNFGLTVLLLLVALIVTNVVFALKVSNRLDATSTGFYSLSDNTKQLLSKLAQPVTAYAILPEQGDREINDIRQLLLACEEASDGKFKVKFLSAVANKADLKNLRIKYPQLDLVLEQRNVEGAVILATGEDEKRHAVIPDTEFGATEGVGKSQQRVFQGESRLFRELAVLADTDTKPVVYFTQSNGELSISGEDAPEDRKATRLKAYLEKNYLEVKPLNFSLADPVVPADAAVVVVAEPQVPFSAAAAGAIRNYVTNPNKKGRLLVLAGVVPGPNNKGVMKTGLEDVLLKDLNVRLGDRFVYTFPLDQNSHPLLTLAGFTDVAIKARNEVAVTMAKAVRTLPMVLPREVAPATNNPGLQAIPLLGSIGVTWVEDDRLSQPALLEAINLLQRSEDYAMSKQLSKRNRPLAVLVTDTSNPREPMPIAAVYGNATFVSDQLGRQSQGESAPFQFDLIGVTIDWLRGRPSIAASTIEAKKYSTYTFPNPTTVDTTRLLYLPLGIALFSIVGIGAGVWVIRRR